MCIKTQRLLLRPWREEDAPSLYRYAGDPRVGPIAGWPVHTSVEHSRQIIRDVLSAPETYAVVLRETGEPVGSAGILLPGHGTVAMEPREAEIGYWLGVPFWGQGLIPEAVEALLERCFRELQCDRVWCASFDGNEKSRRVQKKCGFQFQYDLTEQPNPWNGSSVTHVSALHWTEWADGLAMPGEANSAIFRLLEGKERLTYQLFDLIRTAKSPNIWTSGLNWLLGRSGVGAPLWLWVRELPREEPLVELLAQLLKEQRSVKINTAPALKPVLEQAARRVGLHCRTRMPMTVYACRAVLSPCAEGVLRTAAAEDTAVVARLVQVIAAEGDGVQLSPEACHQAAEELIGSDHLFVWEHGGMVSAMAQIAQEDRGVARLNLVVTLPEQRGRGYAAGLVGALSRQLLERQVTPMLYADQRNPASNRLYQKLGYEAVGEITEFCFEEGLS